jgi:hypothetical protein
MVATRTRLTTRRTAPLLLLSLLALSTTASCSKLNPLGFLSGGTNVAANTQVGKTNTQTIGTTKVQESRTEFTDTTVERYEQTQDQDNTVKTDSVQNLTINEIPPWIILVALLGWLLPTPADMLRSFGNFILLLFRRRD